MRCMALAEALAGLKFRPVFFSRNPSAALTARITREGFGLEAMTTQTGSIEDARELCALAAREGARAAVVDGYRFDSTYLAEVARGHVELVVVDDCATGSVANARIVVNQNAFAPPADPGRGLLFGLNFALLRKEFVAGHAEPYPRVPGSGRILITLGGSDPDAVTPLAIEASGLAFPHVKAVDVAVGFANPGRRAVEAAAGRSPIPIAVHVDVDDMVSLMQRADLTIVAAGATMWEALCVGTPMIVIYRDHLQQKSVDALASQRLLVAREHVKNLNAAELSKTLGHAIADRAALEDISRRGRLLVDGRGASRVANTIAAFA